MIKGYINVKNKIEGMHCYEGAPAEVAFLKQPHRHMFYINTQIEVFHDDRELEFIMVQHRIQKELEQSYDLPNLGTRSCEMIARNLLDTLQEWYGIDRDIWVSVYEDNENGATVKYTKEDK
jgi:hypothetical protein